MNGEKVRKEWRIGRKERKKEEKRKNEITENERKA